MGQAFYALPSQAAALRTWRPPEIRLSDQVAYAFQSAITAVQTAQEDYGRLRSVFAVRVSPNPSCLRR